MTFRTPVLAGAFVSLALLAGSALPADAAGPLKVLAFTAKAKVTVVPAGATSPIEFDADYWVQGELLRTEVTDQSSKTTIGTIMRDKTIYYWVFGNETGTKVPSSSPEGQGSSTFADIAECVAKAKPGPTETIDDVTATKYSYKNCSGKGEASVWITKDGWVKKMTLSREGATQTVVFRNVEPGNIPENRFMPPPRIPFIAPPSDTPASPAPAPKK